MLLQNQQFIKKISKIAKNEAQKSKKLEKPE